jgi:hypothetical protein
MSGWNSLSASSNEPIATALVGDIAAMASSCVYEPQMFPGDAPECHASGLQTCMQL